MTEPTTIKLWRAVRVTPQKVPQTLADCDTERLALLHEPSHGMVVLQRCGGRATTSEGKAVWGEPNFYAFIRYLDGQQPVAPPVPTRFGELRDGQCFRCNQMPLMWRHEHAAYTLESDGTVRVWGSCPEPSMMIKFIPDIEMVLEELP